MTKEEQKAKNLLLAQGQIEWLKPLNVSKEYGFSTSTLAKWRMDNKNLPFSKMGKYIRYRKSDIEKFIESNLVDVEVG